MTLKEYAQNKGIQYATAWKHWKRGFIKGRKLKDGLIVVMGGVLPFKGRPQFWTKGKVIRAVYEFCNGNYILASRFPRGLYRACQKYCGSVRAAKWEAKIIHGRHWNREKFLKCVRQFCLKRYREDKDWPYNLRALAKKYCGSIRKAKWEAGILYDTRAKVRDHYRTLQGQWNRNKLLHWVSAFLKEGYVKPNFWPGYIRTLVVKEFGTTRKAMWLAKSLKEQRIQAR